MHIHPDLIKSEYLWKFLFFIIGTEIGFLENKENFTKGMDLEKVLQLRGTLNLRVIPLDLPLLLHIERSISQTTCELKEVRFLVDEDTLLWKSVNLRQKSRSSRSELNVEVAVESADRKVSFLDSVARTCNKMLLCITSTTSVYRHRFNKIMFPGFLPISRVEVSAKVRQ